MAQFADLISVIASGYYLGPVLDSTGLDGGWDFTLSWSSAGIARGISARGRGGDTGQPAADIPAAPDPNPNGALSISDAINQQLGLKLEEKKRSLPVLVIDHVEEKPTEN
jgi:uncharacterized protein (TIGR03435 family)